MQYLLKQWTKQVKKKRIILWYEESESCYENSHQVELVNLAYYKVMCIPCNIIEKDTEYGYCYKYNIVYTHNTLTIEREVPTQKIRHV